MVNSRSQRIDIFNASSAMFSSFFRRVLAMALNSSISLSIRGHLLSFIDSAFQSLDSPLVRRECAPLVSISIWHNLSSTEVRDQKLDKQPQNKKAWKAASKRYQASDSR